MYYRHLKKCLHACTRTNLYVCMHVFKFATLAKSLNSDMQEFCRVAQNFLTHMHFVHLYEILPYSLLQICIGNIRKCHVSESRICRKFHFWSSARPSNASNVHILYYVNHTQSMHMHIASFTPCTLRKFCPRRRMFGCIYILQSLSYTRASFRFYNTSNCTAF